MYSHVAGVARSGVLLVGREVHDRAGRDGNIDIALCVTGPDLRALGVQGNGDLAALLDPLGLTGIVDDRLWNACVSELLLSMPRAAKSSAGGPV